MSAGRTPPVRAAIRRAGVADAEAIVAIYNREVAGSTATFDTEPRAIETEREILQQGDPTHRVLVAVEEGRVLGWASLSPWSPRRAYDGTVETSVYVEESARGHGIGRRLLASLLETARTAGLHTVLARVADGSVASLRLHVDLGFRRVGRMREVGFKFGRWIDVDLLQLPLDASMKEAPGRRAPATRVRRIEASRSAASRRKRRTPPAR
ncbi:MAG TPA: GNAT family N-acetyltransferase [Thermoplasmata archaeon]|nr:GNAT family N-acetyltransferase [Thermoplasmata archaeon]